MTIEQFIMKVHSIAKIGELFSKDPYALENYEELRKLSTQMLEQLTQTPINHTLYTRDIYPTPNISVRVLIPNENGQFLMVQEADDLTYSLPGGWCDVFESPQENAIKECRQETGYDVKIDRLLGIFFRDKYKAQKDRLISEYALYFSGHIIGGNNQFNHEIVSTKFVDEASLPKLSVKNSPEELKRVLACYKNGTCDFD